ncbi:hypothetical protein [Kribbella sp. NPDC048915]|uniref:hypothetical protein n=1 Tax=Kribbella sp. NPDC048915 TaxID=3155148 RepID=UPI003402C18B
MVERYRRAWQVTCGVVGVVGVVIGFVVLPMAAWGVFGLLAVVVALAMVVGDDPETGEGPSVGRSILVGVAAAVGVAAVLGFAAVLGAGALVLLLFLAAGAPPAVRRYASLLGIGRQVEAPVVAEVGTDRLCRDWLNSYDALRNADSELERLRIVADRQRCLDELERRDPEGFQAWLGSAAGPATDPRRFLTDHEG